MYQLSYEKVYQTRGDARGVFMWLDDSPDLEAPPPFESDNLLDMLSDRPIYLTAHRVELRSPQVLPNLRFMVGEVTSRELYYGFHDTAETDEAQMSETTDILVSLMHSTKNKDMAECRDAFEVAAKCAMRIVEANPAEHYLFDATEQLPDKWSREECYVQVASRLVVTVVANMRDPR